MIVTKFNSLIKTRIHESIQIQFFFLKFQEKGKDLLIEERKLMATKEMVEIQIHD